MSLRDTGSWKTDRRKNQKWHDRKLIKRGKNTRVIHGFQKLVFHFKLQALPQQQHGKLRPREIKRFFCLHVILYCSKTHAIAVMLSNPARTKTRAHGVLLHSKHQRGSGSKITKPSDWKSIISDPAWNMVLSNAAINHTETKTTLFSPPFFFFHHEMNTKLINQVYYLWFVLHCETIWAVRNADGEREHSNAENMDFPFEKNTTVVIFLRHNLIPIRKTQTAKNERGMDWKRCGQRGSYFTTSCKNF